MKRLMSIACIILSETLCCLGQTRDAAPMEGKTYIGTDIVSGICFGTIRLGIAHSFNANWSAGGEAGLDLNVIYRNTDEREAGHRDLLTDKEDRSGSAFRMPFLDAGIHIDYWPLKAFNGPWLRLGGKLSDRSGPDMTVGAGYSMHIWKGLGADISYNIGIIEAYKNRTLPYSGIKAGIHYVF